MIPLNMVLALTSLFPMTAEIDFSGLPQKGTFVAYILNVKLSLSNQQDLTVPVTVSQNADPDDVQSSVFAALKQTGWDVERDGLKLKIVGKGQANVVKIEVESSGATPVVRWLPKQ